LQSQRSPFNRLSGTFAEQERKHASASVYGELGLADYLDADDRKGKLGVDTDSLPAEKQVKVCWCRIQSDRSGSMTAQKPRDERSALKHELNDMLQAQRQRTRHAGGNSCNVIYTPVP